MLNINSVYQGDCLDVMQKINDKCIDMILTSPPYDNLRIYGNNETILNWRMILVSLFRVLKDGGVCVWIVRDETINGDKTGTSFKQALYAKYIGFKLHDVMIWEKPTFTDTGSLRVRYPNVFEYMFIFVKGKLKTFNPLKDRLLKRPFGIKHGTVRQKDGTLKMQSSLGKKYTHTHSYRFNVWHKSGVVSNKERLHPAQFPISLATDHILSWSNEGDIVLDPLAGSGTTAIACINTNRNYILIEKEQKYVDIINQRIEKE